MKNIGTYVLTLGFCLAFFSCKNSGNAPSEMAITGDYHLVYGSSLSDREMLEARVTGNTPPKFAEVISRWKRFSGATYYADATAITANPAYCDDNGMDGNGSWLNVTNPSNQTVNPNTAAACNTESMNSLSWVYLTNPDRLFNIQNTTNYVGFFSTLKFEDFTAEAVVSSTDTDDDAIGVTVAVYFDSVQNIVHTLSAYRTQGGFPAPNLGWGLLHKENNTVVRTIANRSLGGVNANGTSGDQQGWNGRMSKIRVVRAGNNVKVYASTWGTDASALTIDETSLIEVDLSNPAENLTQFMGPQSYGYESISQARATFSNLSFIIPQQGDENPDYLFDLRDNKVYGKKASGVGYELIIGMKALDVLGYPKTITNLETQRQFLISSSTSFSEL